MPSGKRHYRLTFADALSAHQRALEFGGRSGVTNADSIKSAIGRPYSGYYRQIALKAAALVESVSTNHGFTDGNKRTTVILLHTLLSKSNYSLNTLQDDPPINEALESLVLNVVNKEIAFDDLIAWFKARICRP